MLKIKKIDKNKEIKIIYRTKWFKINKRLIKHTQVY